MAELYLTFAYVFRRLDMTLYDTIAASMDWSDNHISVFNGHVKVKVGEAGVLTAGIIKSAHCIIGGAGKRIRATSGWARQYYRLLFQQDSRPTRAEVT
jgi:hypothetical protein